ncbi:DUF2382 domain-containing protein [Kribbella catacumbae]|uniref:DUF2382 domain-containing protein n=1 Tax=Kribbella catacumbae TaxID=460086 RepID=UPI0003803471|nr:PRC and DUF2382 domain-containing protein [Kribbella catacumbae]
MSTMRELERALGKEVYDAEGQKVGTAAQLYASDQTGQPEWLTVKTGMFGTKESFVPLMGAHTEQDGLHVGALKDAIKDAPRIDDNGRLTEAQAAELYRHYHLQAAPSGRDAGRNAGRNAADRNAADRDAADRNAGGRHASGMDGTGRESMVRSEEELRAGTETVETGRVRLHKHVVTEEQEVTVPVSHEEVHVTREPVRDGEQRPGSIQEEEQEVVLHEERPVVAKETVAKERVGLETETVRGEQQVKDTVRKEQIEVDDTRH